jgi:hypothetical protein
MNRSIALALRNVDPIPLALRKDQTGNEPADRILINVGALFLHHYEDSFPLGPPKPDPSRYEYLELVSGDDDFRFHDHVAHASTLKKRSLSAEIGQAFCRLLLQEYFGVTYFAHMGTVVDKPSHPAFKGIRVVRSQRGDTPDYLCCGQHGDPVVAESKGRFAPLSFASPAFGKWRQQFDRIQILAKSGVTKRVKGYIVATQFGIATKPRATCSFIEDPEVEGEARLGDDAAALTRGIAALHYGGIFRKLNLQLLASALFDGFALARDVQFQVPVWTCVAPPLRGREFVGGFYRTAEGVLPQLTAEGWQLSFELDRGHAVFVGLERQIAVQVAEAARGNWDALIDLPLLRPELVEGYSSDITWLLDGVVAAPLTHFAPTALQAL